MAAPGSFPDGGLAVVIGANGGIGEALFVQLTGLGTFSRVIGLSRRSSPAIDLVREETVAGAARMVAETRLPLRLLFNAAGFLHGEGMAPEKSIRQLDAAHMAHAFAVNAIGPGLLMKHFLPLLPQNGKAVFATLSAKVGSIGDNHLGGWYSYRASKAALNQLVRTAAIELRRRAPEAVCVALHPGTVATALSRPFAKTGLSVQTPREAASRLIRTIERFGAESSGGFFNQHGEPLPW